MTEHLQGYPYSQDVITRLHERAESYRQSSPSVAHTADLLDEAAGCIAALLADLTAYRLTMDRIACEVGDMQPLQGFDGNGVDTDQGFRTTPETYCDFQAPIPPPGPPCPKCGSPLHQGYGLAGGGMGAYEMCEAEGCGHFEKWQDVEMEE